MRHARLLVALSLGALAAPTLAQPLPNAVRTIFLERGPGSGSTPMAVAFHPGFNRYYASNGGNPGFSAWVYDSAGNRIQDLAALGIDARGWMYNPNTNKLEVSTFDPVSPSPDYGLMEALTDGSGNLTGLKAVLLDTISGIAGSQSMAAYDPDANVIYSRMFGAGVNVCLRSNGALTTTFNLDLAAAGVGPGDLADYPIGYDPGSQWIVVVDWVRDHAVVFTTSGAYVGTSKLDINVASTFRMGYTNSQLFVFDDSRNGWQGYDIGAGVPVCYADCEEDGDLDVFDYLCFLGLYANQDPYADCEGDGDWDVFDFLCYQGKYSNGCD